PKESMAMLVLALLPLLATSASAAGGCAAEASLSSPNGNAYAACSDLPRLGATVHWTYDGAAGSLSVAFVAAPAAPGGWVAWGLNPFGEGMAGAQALLAAPSSSSGAWAVRTYNISGYALGAPGPIAFPATGLAAELGADGRVRVSGTLSVGQGAAVLNQVWQVGSAVSGDGIPAPHAMGGDNLAAKAKLDLVRQTTSSSDSGGSGLARERNVNPWYPQRRELGPAAAHGSHLREVPQDVQVGGPRVVLPPRDLPDHRVRRRGRRLGHRHQPRQRVQRRHLRSPPQHRHRRLRPRHPTSICAVPEAEEGSQVPRVLERVPPRGGLRRHHPRDLQRLQGHGHPGRGAAVEDSLRRGRLGARRGGGDAGGGHVERGHQAPRGRAARQDLRRRRLTQWPPAAHRV
uniref:DOMON domain-containing protein n=1 Tax=Aegilops tauschii subsp. strangulata TaxID=200361 RepID=A0A453L6W3_AEGTS